MFLWNSLAFSMFQWMLAIWSLVLCLFYIQLEHLEVLGSRTVEAWLGEFWALLCLYVKWVRLCCSVNILWHFLSLGLEWKLTFSSPVATAELSKFAGILSAILSQHHLLGLYFALSFLIWRISSPSKFEQSRLFKVKKYALERRPLGGGGIHPWPR